MLACPIRMTFCLPTDAWQFWKLVEDARPQVADAADGEAVAARATPLLNESWKARPLAAGGPPAPP